MTKNKKIKSIIISGPLAQDHEFIYPYYRLLEESAVIDVCLTPKTRTRSSCTHHSGDYVNPAELRRDTSSYPRQLYETTGTGRQHPQRRFFSINHN